MYFLKSCKRIGVQNITSNTVNGRIIIDMRGLLERDLPKTGRHKDITINVEWQNLSSETPVTNGMVADKLQTSMMGDYPLLLIGTVS